MRTGKTWGMKDDKEKAIAQLAEIKRLGYDCIDFQSFINTENEFFGESAQVAKLLRFVKDAVADAGLTISQAHGPWRFPPQDVTQQERDERFEKMVRALYSTAQLGCTDMVIHPLMPYGCNKNPNPEEYMEINLEFFGRLADEAKKAGVVVDFENMPMPALTLASPEQILDFVKKINSPYFRVCIDTGHCAVLKESPADAVRKIGKEYLRVLHIHDNDGVRDLHWLPGTGVIDWSDFSKALYDIGFDGVFSLETVIKAAELTPDEYRAKTEELAKTAKRIANREF